MSSALALAPAGPRLPEEFCLPGGYRQQDVAHTHDEARPEGGPEYWNAERIAASARYQFHVYAWAAQVVRRRGLRSVLDVGCGPATKLKNLIAPWCDDIEGIDQPSGVAAARACGAPGRYTEVDLEQPDRVTPWRTFDLIICSDVVEHLIDPDPMMAYIRRFAHKQTRIMFSTPDRARLRGRACMASDKPEHVREWSFLEFGRFLRSRRYRIALTRLLPADNAPLSAGRWQEWRWRLRLADTSPHRCQTFLCRAAAG
jgi:SAM-dependent methyltransferase